MRGGGHQNICEGEALLANIKYDTVVLATIWALYICAFMHANVSGVCVVRFWLGRKRVCSHGDIVVQNLCARQCHFVPKLFDYLPYAKESCFRLLLMPLLHTCLIRIGNIMSYDHK